METINSVLAILLIIPIAAAIRGLDPIIYKKINEQVATDHRATALSTISTMSQLFFIVLNYGTSILLDFFSQQHIIFIFGILMGIIMVTLLIKIQKRNLMG